MKSVLISIKPKWAEKIVKGEKTIEVRKTRPKIETPFKCYIYATKPKKWFRFSSLGRASDENLWLSNGKVKMCDGFEFWADGKEYECLSGKVIGEFICDKVYKIEPIFSFYDCYSGYDDSSDCSYFEDYSIDDERIKKTCLTRQELYIYGKEKPLYGWHISELKIYDKPKELSEFKRWNRTEENAPCAHTKLLYPDCKDCKACNLTRPPQSLCYVEEL